MAFIGNYNPLSCDNYLNAGNYFQTQLSNHSNLVIRTALVFAKIVGRGQDVLIHAGLGSIKLIASIAMAIYSIPASAFDYIPTHHKIAKQASRHFGLALFFMADIPLSLANILKMYPKSLCRKIQQKLRVSPTELAFDPLIDSLHTTVGTLSGRQGTLYRETYQENEQLKQLNKQLKQENTKLLEKYTNLLQAKLEHANYQIAQEETLYS
ncbi:hypothetical protein [Candidatus Rhabdochlamydia sp. T3358]|uniref:hypothetical protein n=1 Tax=Candidatus Rhabdochlamydia sp. T3358 TaxID=2099795 RepID=UPI0010B8BC68|nr:hypothetical protein [Candidatus Rhabdochlamydia sp. T3358]VHO04191.1 hypothetical protein RHT_01247 [Candidatus Rhabdochlamydia sp. T3358]